MESDYSAWVGERVKRVMAAPKCLHRREFGTANDCKRGDWKIGIEATTVQQRRAFT